MANCTNVACRHPLDRHRRVGASCCLVEGCACDAFEGEPIASDVRDSAPEATPTPEVASVHEATPPRAPQVTTSRRHMSDTRPAKTRAFTLAQTSDSGQVERVKLYFTVGFFEDGSVGEVFIKADRQGSLTSGALDAVGIFASVMLQYGVPLVEVIDKLRGMRFPPDGRVTIVPGGESVFATSPLDLLARWLTTFLPPEAP